MKKLICLLALSLVGCAPLSMNLQRAALRGTGDTVLTLILDESSDNGYPETISKIKDIASAILKFLDDGKVADLTQSQIGTEILKLVPAKYKSWGIQLLAVVSVSDIEVEEDKIDKIGKNNVARLKAFLKGTIRGAEEYRKEDRPPGPKFYVGPPPTDSGPGGPEGQPAQPDGQPTQPDEA